jgi:hypothetical protein
MANVSKALCSVCEDIDFEKYFQCEVNVCRGDGYLVSGSKDAVRLGHLKEIYERGVFCAFCRLAIQALCRRWWRYKWVSSKELLERDSREGLKIECYIFSYLCADNNGLDPLSSVSKADHSISERAYRIGIGTRVPTDKAIPYLDHAGDIQLSASSAAKMKKGVMFYGSAIDPSRVNMKLARDWLTRCEVQHGQFCELPAIDYKAAMPLEPPRDLLVIDVQSMCLCQLPLGSRYIALSYCWPTKGALVTTQTTLNEFLVAESLTKKMANLPRCIQDTIQCVKELEERYLWIDALCIIQDNEAHKHDQIYQIDRVYSSSVLTLICAPPDSRIGIDIDHGLPGFRTGTRISEQAFEVVKDLELLSSFPSLYMSISESRWETRAWTFQEDRLSRRKLYFTETQLYFQCSCSIFCEDAVGEGNRSDAFIYPYTNLWSTSAIQSSQWDNQEHTATWLSRSPYRSPVESISSYARLVSQFCGRQMSDPKDIIHAFDGILSSLRSSMNTEFWAGLPEAFLDEALLWMDKGEHIRSASARTTGHALFPSWSWAGWETGVDYDHLSETSVQPETYWFIINQSDLAIRLYFPGSYNHSLHPTTTSGDKNVRLPGEPPQEFLKTVQCRAHVSARDLQWSSPRFLACWTSVASFNISGTTLDLNHDLGTILKSRECLTISDDVGRFVGSIMMGRSWKINALSKGHVFDFMLLSRSRNLTKYTMFDQSVFPIRDWCCLNVMLIQRHADKAQRLGIGMIHEDAWVAANPFSMLTRLE